MRWQGPELVSMPLMSVWVINEACRSSHSRRLRDLNEYGSPTQCWFTIVSADRARCRLSSAVQSYPFAPISCTPWMSTLPLRPQTASLLAPSSFQHAGRSPRHDNIIQLLHQSSLDLTRRLVLSRSARPTCYCNLAYFSREELRKAYIRRGKRSNRDASPAKQYILVAGLSLEIFFASGKETACFAEDDHACLHNVSSYVFYIRQSQTGSRGDTAQIKYSHRCPTSACLRTSTCPIGLQ